MTSEQHPQEDTTHNEEKPRDDGLSRLEHALVQHTIALEKHTDTMHALMASLSIHGNRIAEAVQAGEDVVPRLEGVAEQMNSAAGRMSGAASHMDKAGGRMDDASGSMDRAAGRMVDAAESMDYAAGRMMDAGEMM